MATLRSATVQSSLATTSSVDSTRPPPLGCQTSPMCLSLPATALKRTQTSPRPASRPRSRCSVNPSNTLASSTVSASSQSTCEPSAEKSVDTLATRSRVPSTTPKPAAAAFWHPAAPSALASALVPFLVALGAGALVSLRPSWSNPSSNSASSRSCASPASTSRYKSERCRSRRRDDVDFFRIGRGSGGLRVTIAPSPPAAASSPASPLSARGGWVHRVVRPLAKAGGSISSSSMGCVVGSASASRNSPRVSWAAGVDSNSSRRVRTVIPHTRIT
mmetsp:Transcript_31576/g.70982  ORF Transcript_31576/g.70982 Transcript_31576/m.70982 type:complete len:275 (+) Transcript_31576:399-1223(+)